jgi:hypothetical protein
MYEKILSVNEAFTTKMLKHQELDSSNKYYGGIIDPNTGVAMPSHGSTPRVMAAWAASVMNPDSTYYQNKELITRLEKASEYMLRQQHSDGTISLGSTNFHSPPDTGFVVVGLSQVYLVLNKNQSDNLKKLTTNIKLFLERTIPALRTGGCHTPNHRWVISAALSFLYKIFGEEKLIERIEEWLAEGLDYTDDGEWTERSNGIYNGVNNKMLYYLAMNINRPELLEGVRKNLELMQYLVHPSGEVVTDYSGRQDFGTKSNLSNYYLIYRLMAVQDQNPLFAYMADLAAQQMHESGSVDNNAMLGYLLYEFLKQDEAKGERKAIPEQYEKIINKNHPREAYLKQLDAVGYTHKIQHSAPHTAFGSPVVRYRKKDVSATVMSNTPSIFSLRHGKVRLLGVKVSTAFSPGVVYFDEFEEKNSGYRLRTVLEKGYNGPISAQHLVNLEQIEQDLNPWYLLPHQHREITHLQQHELTIDILPSEDSWKIHIVSDQLEEVFTQITCIFGEEGTITGEHVKQGKNNQYFLTKGEAVYSVGDDAISISPGVYEHWLETVRDDSHTQGCTHLSFNVMTPFDLTIDLKLL